MRLPAHAEAFADAFQRISEESGSCALPGQTADFFVVKQTEHGSMRLPLPCQKSLEAGEGTLQIVQTRARDKFARWSPDAALLPRINEKIVAEEIFFGDTGGLRDHLQECPAGGTIAVDRQQIRLHVQFVFFAGALEVRRDARNQQHIAVEVD